MSRLALLVAAAVLFAPAAQPAKKKKKDPNEFPPVIIRPQKEEKEVTQALPALREPPRAVVVEAARLSFLTTPLSSKGLLSQQTRDALKWLFQNSRGGTIMKLRAFVAGTGDVRRIQEIVSEVFDDRHVDLPAITVVQVGVLPLEGAQVVLEATLVDRKTVNENGLAFISGQRATREDPTGPLETAVRAANLDGTDVRRVTCYLSSLEDLDRTRTDVQRVFPSAVTTYVQVLRGAVDRFVECEAVAALKRVPVQPVLYVDAPGARFSVAAMVGPGRLALTGAQLGFRTEEADLRLAFDRLGKTLESVGATYQEVVLVRLYSLTNTTGERVTKMIGEYRGSDQKAAAGTVLTFEGLPGLDAAFAIDVIAAL